MGVQELAMIGIAIGGLVVGFGGSGLLGKFLRGRKAKPAPSKE